LALPELLLLSDLLHRRVRCDRGLDHGAGVLGWMHPPVHRLLGWVSRPSLLRQERQVWRLDQLRGLSEQEAFVKGDPTPTDPATLERLPTLLEASLLGGDGQTLGTVADAAVELRTGRIRHYLVARSDPRLPGGSRWRLAPDRIVDQQPGRVFTGLAELDDLPIAHASVRQELLRRSRHWRSRLGEETERLRRQVQEAGGRFEERVEGWLEEPPADQEPRPQRDWDREIWPEDDAPEPPRQPRPRSQPRGRDDDDDPWV
jgi:sporulation protein YlmC with PRC-barrel domain